MVKNKKRIFVAEDPQKLDKLIDVVRVSDITGDNMTTRELALIKVKATSATRSEIIEIADIFRANIVDVGSDSLTIEITGDEDKVDSMLKLQRGFGIREIARTGRIAMVRGAISTTQIEEKAPRSQRKWGQGLFSDYNLT